MSATRVSDSASRRTARGFAGNVATLFSGKAGAFAIAFLLTPIIARLFDPADYGVAALLLAVVAVLGTLATLRYDLAIVLIEDTAQAVRMVWVALYTSLFWGSLLLVAGIIVAAVTGVPPLHERLGWTAWVIPGAVVLMGAMRTAEGWCVRERSYRRLAAGDITMAGTNSGLRLIAGAVSGSSVWALVASYFTAQTGKIALLARSLPPGELAHSASDVTSMRGLAHRYRDFPLYNATAELAREFAQKLPVLMLGFLFTPAIVGLYAMGMRLIQAPLGMLVTSFRRVYLQRAAELKNADQGLRTTLFQATGVCLGLALVPFGVLLLFGEELLTLLLGERWAAAGRYAEILAPFLLAVWVTTPSSATLIVIRRQKLWLRLQLAIAAVQLVAMLAAFRTWGTPEATVWAHVIVGVAGSLCVILMTFLAVRPPTQAPAT